MKNLQLSFSSYTLKLKKPFITSKKEIKERNGFILTLLDAEENEGIGDCCPFPELGSETLKTAEDALSDIHLEININSDDIENSITDNLKKFDKLPALRHGLEQALLNLMCKVKKVKIDELLDLDLKKQIFVNAAIGFLSQDESTIEAVNFVNEGYGTIKVKAGRKNFDDDLSVVTTANGTVTYDVEFTLDQVNRVGVTIIDRPIENGTSLTTDANLNVTETPMEAVRVNITAGAGSVDFHVMQSGN